MKASWGKLALWGAALAALPCLAAPIRNPDLYWHLSAARFMVKTGAVPRADFLSWTRAGTPWLDFEWLAQMIYYLTERAAGCVGLAALRAAVVGSAIAVDAAVCVLCGLGPGAAGLAILFLAAAVFPYADLRPDNFSLLFFAIVLYALEAIRRGKLRARPRLYIAAACFFALWANLHLGLVFGLALIFIYGTAELIPVPGARAGRGANFARLFAASAAGTLATPYSWRLYGVIVQHAEFLRTLGRVICEWKPPELDAYWLWPYTLLLLGSLVVLLWHFLKTKRTPWAVFFSVAYFGLASSFSQRHLTYFCVLAVPAALSLVFEATPARRRPWLAAGAAILGLALAGYVGRVVVPMLGAEFCVDTQRSLADFLEAQSPALGGKVLYNTWEDGGYLGWRLFPAYRVFYDGRYIFHPFIEEVIGAAKTAEGWRAFAARYGIEVACLRRSPLHATMEVVAGRGGRRAAVERPYYLSYLPRKEWALVFWDEQRMVLVKRGAVPAAWLAAHEYSFLRPDDDGWLGLKASGFPRAAVAAELARHRLEARSPRDAAETAALAGFLRQSYGGAL